MLNNCAQSALPQVCVSMKEIGAECNETRLPPTNNNITFWNPANIQEFYFAKKNTALTAGVCFSNTNAMPITLYFYLLIESIARSSIKPQL